MTLGEKIQKMRKKAGLSQEDLAEVLGVSRQAVSKWETEEATPEVEKLLLLSRTFGVTADWLISDDGPDAPPTPESFREEPRVETRDTPPYIEPEPDRAELAGEALGRMIKRHGRSVGLRAALIGGALVLAGAVLWFLALSAPGVTDTGITYTEESVPVIQSGTAFIEEDAIHAESGTVAFEESP